jgi:L-ascorbate metabolism protein UlaG (beta-lactamase superfamily)
MAFELTWIGHAALSITTGEFKLLVDPYIRENPSAKADPDTIEADYILVTHGHGDHLGDSIEIARRTGATVIANTEVAGWLSKKGIKTHGQQIGGGFTHPFGYLKPTLALHGSGLPDGTYGGIAAGFLLTTNDGEKIYMAGDTGLFGDMRLIGEEGIALAVLPIGGNYTMGPDDALRAVKLLSPEHVIPIHYSTWGLIAQDPNAWAEQVEKETDAKAHVLKPGEQFIYP